MDCTKCNSSNSIKKGLRNNKQRFYCKDCQSYFQSSYNYKAYKDGVNTSTEYIYDVNENMISDANKGITRINYNHCNPSAKYVLLN